MPDQDESDKGEQLAAYFEHLGHVLPAGYGQRAVKCPFHDDSHASATVHGGKGIFNCFTCGANGDALKLIMDNEGVDFGGAIRFIEEVLGCTTGSASGQRRGTYLSSGKRANKSGRRYVPPRKRTFGSLG